MIIYKLEKCPQAKQDLQKMVNKINERLKNEHKTKLAAFKHWETIVRNAIYD